MEKGQMKELLEFQINRNITNLYKSFLMILEDIQDQNQNNFQKLKSALPENQALIEQANCVDNARMEFVRKQILDNGNNAQREIIGHLEKFDLTIN